MNQDYYYPEQRPHQVLAYGFRPIFLLMPPYVILSMLLWVMMWTGIIPMTWLEQPLDWHIYEMLFGMGMASLIAFLLTALPEMYAGVYPLVGKPLGGIILLWTLGRVGMWTMAFTGIWLTAILNIALLGVLAVVAFKPMMLDPLRKNVSIFFTVVVLWFLQILFFSTKLSLVSFSSLAVLKLSVGIFMVLILLALRRVNSEAINFYLKEHGIDEIYYPRSFRYNMAIFTIFLFSVVEFFDFKNTSLAWLSLAAMAATLGTLSDFKLKNYFILHYAYVLYMGSIPIMMALGYGFIAYAYFKEQIFLSHFRHFFTSGALGLAVFLTMNIISQIHTGRKLQAKISISAGVVLIIVATCLRVAVRFYPAQANILYASSAVLWVIPFALFLFSFGKILQSPRVDGLPG